jgi:ubiquinone/menaquinone biosynthesis C-methylase UbiE
VPDNIYTSLAQIYSHLMRSIDYKKWAEYLSSISDEISEKNLDVLELAAGNCKIAECLNRKYGRLIVSDISSNMLQQNNNPEMIKICCDMTSLPFRNKFDFIYSTFDSVNYIKSKNKYKQFFRSVADCLNDKGIFTFDVSLEKNSIKYERYLNRTGKYNGIEYKQKSFYDRSKNIHYNYFKFTFADGKKVEEMHKQKIYPFEEYFKLIDQSGFYVHKCFQSFTFKNADSNTERAQFILKKNQNVEI